MSQGTSHLLDNWVVASEQNATRNGYWQGSFRIQIVHSLEAPRASSSPDHGRLGTESLVSRGRGPLGGRGGPTGIGPNN